MNSQKFRILTLIFMVIFTTFNAYPMDKPQMTSDMAMFKDPYDDNSCACCLCGLAVCTCACATVGCLALTEGFPATAALWWLMSSCSGLCLKEVYHGYRDEQKRLLSLTKNN